MSKYYIRPQEKATQFCFVLQTRQIFLGTWFNARTNLFDLYIAVLGMQEQTCLISILPFWVTALLALDITAIM